MWIEYLTPRRRARAMPRRGGRLADPPPRAGLAHRGEVRRARDSPAAASTRTTGAPWMICADLPRVHLHEGAHAARPRGQGAAPTPCRSAPRPRPRPRPPAQGPRAGAPRASARRSAPARSAGRVRESRAGASRHSSSTSGSFAKRRPARERAQPEVVVLRARRTRGSRRGARSAAARIITEGWASGDSTSRSRAIASWSSERVRPLDVGAHARRCRRAPSSTSAHAAAQRRRAPGPRPGAPPARASRSGMRDVVGVHARQQRRRAPRRGRVQRRHQPAGAPAITRTRVARAAPLEQRRGCRRVEPSSTATTSWSARVWARSEARHAAASPPRRARAGGRRRGEQRRSALPATRTRAPRAARSPATGPRPRRTGPPPPGRQSSRGARRISACQPRLVAHRLAGSRRPSPRGAAWSGCRGWRRASAPGRPTARAPDTTSSSAARLSGGMNRNSTP